MSPKSDLIRLKHMLDASEKVVLFLREKKRKDLDEDEKLALAVVRLIEVIGEAATKLEKRVREVHSAIPWEQIIGTRNRLIHGYEEVDLDIVWQIATIDLPTLVGKLRHAIEIESLQ